MHITPNNLHSSHEQDKVGLLSQQLGFDRITQTEDSKKGIKLDKVYVYVHINAVCMHVDR